MNAVFVSIRVANTLHNMSHLWRQTVKAVFHGDRQELCNHVVGLESVDCCILSFMCHLVYTRVRASAPRISRLTRH